MKKNKIYSFIAFLCCSLIIAQTGNVGVSSTPFVPQENLDVNGKTYANSVYLRDPGEPLETGGKFLASVADKAVRNSKDTPFTKYSGNKPLFNYIQLNLNNVASSGITDFNTKISTKEFVLVIHNYAFKNYSSNSNSSINGTTTVTLRNSNANVQGSPNITAYKGSDDFWHIRANFTNSTFRRVSDFDTNSYRFRIELYMMAYRYLITKQNIENQSVNLGGNDGSASTYSVPKPTGF